MLPIRIVKSNVLSVDPSSDQWRGGFNISGGASVILAPPPVGCRAPSQVAYTVLSIEQTSDSNYHCKQRFKSPESLTNEYESSLS